MPFAIKDETVVHSTVEVHGELWHASDRLSNIDEVGTSLAVDDSTRDAEVSVEP
jgi:hypothetical protein